MASYNTVKIKTDLCITLRKKTEIVLLIIYNTESTYKLCIQLQMGLMKPSLSSDQIL